jgi:hypothetical protein
MEDTGMSKLYFSNLDESGCYTIDTIKALMDDAGIKELEITEAKRDTGNGYFYCTKFQEIGEVGESCGRFCSGYSPRNGKNGKCRYSGYCYEPTDKKRIIKIKP